MISKGSLALVLSIVLFNLFSCEHFNKQKEHRNLEKDTTLFISDVVPDSTIYGITDQSGMSTMRLVTFTGDTIVLDKVGQDGKYSEIYGYISEGDSFAITRKKIVNEDDVLIKAYNLTLINKFKVKYSIKNGLFIIEGDDTVDIETLNKDSMVVVCPSYKKIFYAP